MLEFDHCPGCGAKVLKGAMRCTACGCILKTREEQIASIREAKKRKRRFNIRGLIEPVAVIVALGVLLYYFKGPIISFIRSVLNY